MSAAFSGVVLVLLCWTLRLLRVKSVRQREEADALARELLKVSGINESTPQSEKLCQTIAPRLRRYAYFVGAMEGKGNLLVTWITKGTVRYVVKTLPHALSLDTVEEAWQRFADWREAKYGRSLPTETWRAFHQLIAKRSIF